MTRDPYPPAKPSFPSLGGQELPTSAGPRVGEGWESAVCWGRSWCCALPRPPRLCRGACPPREPVPPAPAPQDLRQEAERATITFPNPARGAEPARPQLRALLGPGEPPGDIGGCWATHSPRPAPLPARPHISGCNLGKFFPFFFFKLSLLSLLGATWWCAGGVSLPPRAPPLSLSAPSRPPLFFPPQWMEAGRLQARSAL